MNLFLVGLGLSELMKEAATKALRSVRTVYPQLDLDTLNIWNDGNAFVGAIHTNPVVASPREYVAKSGQCLTLFAGTPISSDGELVPHRAADLGGHWSQLPKKLDGQFAAVKVDLQNLQLEVLTDPLGMEQVYVHHRGPTVVVSNSVRLIEQTCGLTAIDEIGASLFLSLGWVGGDRTLRESVQVLQGGTVHQWTFNGVRTSVVYWPRTALLRLRAHGDDEWVDDVACRVVSMLRVLSARFGPIECDLTGGRDSRVMVAALLAAGVPATYFTGGAPGSADVRIGTDIAHAFRLSHYVDHNKAAVLPCWDDAVRLLIEQNDGLVNLWQVADCLFQDHPLARLPVHLWGTGGEIARGFYYQHVPGLSTCQARDMMQAFPAALLGTDTALLTPQARQLALASVRDTCQGLLHEGFEPGDVPDAFYAYDRVRRWAGTNTRKMAQVCDLFTPFCTAPFLEAALAYPLADRIAGRLHVELIRATQPALLDFPFNKPAGAMPKRSAKRVVADTVREAAPAWLLRILRDGARQLQRRKSQEENGPVQAEWVEAKRKSILDVCLSKHSSVLWDYVDRRSFQNIMSSPTAAQVRRAYCKRILSIATLFYYEAER